MTSKANEQRLRNSIYFTSRKLIREVGANVKVEFEVDVLDVISELAWKKLVLYSSDLDAFQKHSKRSTINVDDVKLLVRNNKSLKTLIESKRQTAEDNGQQASKKKRKV